MAKTLKLKWGRGKSPTVRVVADGAIATVVLGNGRLIPVLIVDCTLQPQLEELVRVHQHLPPGDVRVQWAQTLRGDALMLFLSFQRPVQLEVLIGFRLPDSRKIVHHIFQARAVYLQPGHVGDKLSGTLENPRILIDLPDTGFDAAWGKLLRKSLMKTFGQCGLPSDAAAVAAADLVEEWHQMGSLRVSGAKTGESHD